MSPPQGCGDSSTTGDRRDTKHRWGTMSPFFCASPACFLPKKDRDRLSGGPGPVIAGGPGPVIAGGILQHCQC